VGLRFLSCLPINYLLASLARRARVSTQRYVFRGLRYRKQLAHDPCSWQFCEPQRAGARSCESRLSWPHMPWACETFVAERDSRHITMFF
jgi:hypothetical protein